MTKDIRYFFQTVVAGSLLLGGCMGGKTVMHAESTRGIDQLAIVYRTTVHHPGPRDISVVSEIEEVDEKSIISDSRTSPTYREEGILELLPGQHKIGVRVWSLIDNAQFFFPGAGGTMVLGGTTHWHKPVDLSLFNLELRPGKTYVLFIPDADAMDTPLPSQICITEEAHDAPGHKTVPIGYGRTPSPQATIIQCITQQNT